MARARNDMYRLHTSKRMHFIEEFVRWTTALLRATCIRQNVCTSLRSCNATVRMCGIGLAYVKTYALH